MQFKDTALILAGHGSTKNPSLSLDKLAELWRVECLKKQH